MKTLHWIVLLSAIVLFPTTLWAQTAVLIHGLQGKGMDWRMDGVTPGLQQAGWVDGGNFLMTPNGPWNMQRLNGHPEKVFYTVDLPARAPVMLQAQMLNAHLQRIYVERGEPLTLVGHSAGGLAARGWLVRFANVPVEALVTIASPHVGTPAADMACLANDTPMGLFASEMGFGKWMDDAEDLYRDMRIEEPGRFLYWLNHQPHPAIRYVSIMRDNQLNPDLFDFFVPIYSQNMNKVYALAGRSEVWPIDGSHFLGVKDGHALAAILARRPVYAQVTPVPPSPQ
ncbi:MAG: hypothetical protein KJ914_12540 [Gammaproteobacteria bacterium]|nr:hypothetical protein [Gammaproteobacteria bacterium]MBU1725994.1 hypothetical protein [Gammaproteobacteria bacterium]MBU2004959.1 hypothetical protein [Gammaproteobacteria bacterium]